MVIMLAKMLKEEGFRPVVLSRGYGGNKKGDVNIVSDGRNILIGNYEAGDEPFLIAATLKEIPVITGPCRYLTGSFAVKEFGADVLLLDDGFQHRVLHRDVDIVLADSTAPIGNGRLLPCGSLREPLRGLNRADIVVFTGSDPDQGIKASPLPDSFPSGNGRVFRAFHKPLRIIRADGEDIYSLEFLKGKRIFAFAGIGNPRSFIRTIEKLHADLVGFLPFSTIMFLPETILKPSKDRQKNIRPI
jgi:tetraacyldisaccharide 4'-kinase